MRKFRKKPVVIQAQRWDGDEYSIRGLGPELSLVLGELYIHTLEGKMHVEVGDWIIKGVKNELYPCKPDIFDLTYESV